MDDTNDSFDEGLLQPSIVRQFRSILEQYPDNGQILKELIQNAEDAGASTIKFLIDHTQYDTKPDKLLFPSLANLQGPALCAYNDAMFTDEDWKGIRMIQESVKADDPLKVGRFGLGFKSVFHMTDIPGVISNNKVAFIDPQAAYLKRRKTIPQTGETVEVPTTSRALPLRADLIAKYWSQLEPFMHDIFDLSGSTIRCSGGFSYQGTVFRFPLRNTDRSDISSTQYTVQKLKQLCEQLEKESHSLLLFLKHVHTIEVYEKTEAGQPPTLLQSVKVSNQHRGVREGEAAAVLTKRRLFHGGIRERPFEVRSCSYPLATAYWSHSQANTTSSKQWLVTQHYAGNKGLHATENAQLLPLVGVALPVGDSSGGHSYRGHTFCFLPLPQNDDNLTGLKVHVNGYFAVDQSRTHLKWPDHWTQRVVADADWNGWLIKHVLPVALWELVRFAIDFQKQGTLDVTEVYNIMPDHLEIKPNWKPLLNAFWKQLDQYDCLHTSQLPTWRNPKMCYIVSRDDRKYFSVIEKICNYAQLALVNPPEHILNEVGQRCLAKHVTKELIHKVLSKYNIKLSEAERWNILQYLVTEDRMDLILGLRLLKLEDGKWIQFTPASSSMVYLETMECRKSLLPYTSRTFMAAAVYSWYSVADTGYSIMETIANIGRTQVTFLNRSNFPAVLRKACQGIASYQCDQQPLYVEFDWLVTLWRYIARYHTQLHLFEGLPIVPESNQHWSVLEKIVPYVASTLEDATLDDLPVSTGTLKSLGIRVVEAYEQTCAGVSRKLLKEFIARPTAVGILDAFQKLERKKLIKKVESLDHQTKMDLLKLITDATPLQVHHLALLQDLPLLLCYHTSISGIEQWKKKSEVTCATEMDLPVFVTKYIAKSSVCGPYARRIGVPELTATEVLVEVIFPDMMNRHLNRVYTDGEVEKLMRMAMDNFDVYQWNNPRFGQCIREIPFVQSDSGLSPPSKLLDPTEEKTKKMFQGLPVFPVGLFAQRKYAAKLSEHNCFKKKIDDEKLLMLARHIDQNHCSGSLLENGQQLQAFICENVHFISGHTFQKLSSLQWIPVEQDGPKHYPASIPWCGESVFFSSPDKTMAWVPVKDEGPTNSATTMEEYQYLVGSVKPVAKVLLDTDTAKRLQCNQEPMLEEVLENLQNLVQNYRDGDISPVRMLKCIYGYIRGKQDIEIDEEIQSLADESFKWIWGGSCFTDIGHIVLSECSVTLEPYAYQLPHDLSEFTDMFRKLGAQPTAQLNEVLVEIKNFHENNCSDRPQVKRDFQMCLQILDIMESEGSLEAIIENHIPIPVEWDTEVLKLVDCNQCTYCEDNSINIKDIQEELYIVHRDIPRRVVKALGVPNMMSRHLNADELDFTSYGQGEPLTRRIASLLEDYKDGFAVLKELIQNADDAEAREVHFIYDKRDFGKVSKSLIAPEMRQVLGPALLCYNDRVFTDDDFANIVKLSGATKKEKADKVGRFGLGFNVVYNLTDVPSFISRDTIAYFDPHVKYLRQAIKDRSQPGFKLNLKRHGNQIRNFKDQFQVFHGILGCDLQSDPLPSFDGTLFRFPLRTASQAENSEISTNHYSEREVKELFSLLQKTSEYLLLFTQNVSCVKVSEIHMECDPVLCAEIHKTPVQLLHSMEFGDTSNGVPPRHKPEEEYKVLKHASVRAGHAGTDHSNIIVEVQSTFHKSLLLAEADSKGECTFWNVVSVIGSKNAILEKDSVPVGAVAVSLKKKGDALFAPELLDPKHGGLMFCFLPLPIHNQLPVHVNGYFAVTPSRRQLCTQEYNDKRDPKAKWNEFLMQGVIREAYTRAFVDMTKRPDIYDPIDLQNAMVHFFPTDIPEHIDGIGNLLYQFCHSFYSDITSDQDVKLFHDRNKWTSFNLIRFLDSCLLDLLLGQFMVDVCTIYFQQKLDQDFVEIRQSVIRQLETSGFTNELCEHKITLVMFYRDIFLPIIDQVKQDIRDSLVCFALLHGSEELSQIIKNVSCIPVTCSDSLMKPNQLVDPDGPLKDLYSSNDGPFPKWLKEPNRPQKGEIQLALKALGMRVDNITCEETLERALTISELKDGTERARSLVTLVSVKLKAESNTKDFQDLVEKLHRVSFLPVVVRPYAWNLPWKDNKKYVSPEESYTKEQKELVGCSKVIASFPGTKDKKLTEVLNYVNKEVTEEHITHQISCVVEAQSMNKGKDFSRFSFELYQKIMRAIYKFLNEEANSNSSVNFETYKKSPFVMLPGGSIVLPGMCAMKCPGELNPYLFELPSDYQTAYKDLFKALDIVPQFGAGVMVSLLKRLHDDIGTLAKADVFKVALTAATYLSELKDLDKASLQKELYLPDGDKVMTSAQALCFNNCHWMGVQDKKILHKAISSDVASKLGVKSIRKEETHSFQHGIPWGQSEKLANRIKRILEGYPCDKEILQELLQNADDAEADVVYFFLDHRGHPNERVFEGWNSVEGPALLVYNNKPFTAKDIEGIKNLGEGSKNLDPVTTGKYGVGFNCVYHITDTPMFLTPDLEEEDNQILVAFDPNCKYIPGSTTTQPGQKYTNARHLRKTFPDVFSCFEVPGKNFSQGTLFRFPLRTDTMVEVSEISKNVITPGDIRKLFKTFSSNLEQCLLFLENVKEITLNEIQKNNEVIMVDRVVSKPTHKNDGSTYNLRQYIEKVGMVGLTSDRSYTQHYELDIQKQGRNEDAKWLVLQQLGARNPSNIKTELVEKYKEKNAVILPKGGVAIQLSKEKKTQEGRLFCLLPLPVCTKLAMHINGSFMLDHESRHNLADTKTGFGFMWNEFILKEIVADLYIDAMELIADSISLSLGQLPYGQMQASLAYFSSLFPRLTTTSDPYLLLFEEAFYHKWVARRASLLPIIVYKDTWLETTNYAKNKKVGLEWYPVGGQDGKIAYFDDTEKLVCGSHEPLCKGKKQSEKEEVELCKHIQLRKVLANSQFPITQTKLKVKNTLEKYVPAAAKLHTLSPTSILQHFHGQTYAKYNMMIPAHIGCTPFINETSLLTLLEFCQENLLEYLDGLPMLLMANETVQRFSRESTVLVSDYCELLPQQQEKFAHRMFLDYMSMEGIDSFLKPMTATDLAHLLNYVLDEGIYKGIHKMVKFDTKNDLSRIAWVNRLWDFLCTQIVVKKVEQEKPIINRNSLSILQDWCIVPIKMDRYVFVSTKYLDIGINLSANINISLSNIFKKLNFPCPSLLGDSFSKVVHHVVATFEDPAKIVYCLSKALDVCKLDFGKLDQHDCDKIVDYFNENISKLHECEPMSRATLLRLPIFQSVFKKRVKLDAHIGHVFSIPKSIPKDGMEKWCSLTNELFLLHTDKYKELFQFLGVKILSFSEAYCSYILCHFHVFDARERHEHLQEIKAFVERNKMHEKMQLNNEIIAKLKAVPILENKRGQLERIQEFFNPHELLFQIMKENFPMREFQSLNWIHFLKDLGLNYTVEAKHVIKYVNILAQQTAPSELDINEACKLLLDRIFQKENHLLEQCCHVIKHIKFIPCEEPNENLLKLRKPYQGDSGTLVCFAGSVKAKHANLVWTQVTVLPQFATPYTEEMCRCLSVLVEPPLTMVLKNLHEVCHNFQPRHDLETAITTYTKSVFSHVTRYLLKHDLQSMVIIPCIVVGNGARLVKPSQVTLDGTVELPPYLYRVPHSIAQYASLLKRLGVPRTVTVTQYADVLASIHAQSGDTVLNANELQASLKAMAGFFKLLNDPQCETNELRSRTLYFLIEEKKIRQSSDIVFTDNNSLKERVSTLNLPLMVTNYYTEEETAVFNSSHTLSLFDIQRGLRRLTCAQTPLYLSHIVEEKMSNAASEMRKTKTCSELEEKLSSFEFQRGILRILKHQRLGRNLGNNYDTDEHLVSQLNSIKFHEVASLNTHLLYKNKKVEASEQESEICIQKSGDERRMYIARSHMKCRSKVHTSICRIIDEIMEGNITACLTHVIDILDCSINDIQSVLDQACIAALDAPSDGLFYIPMPGDYIPEEHHCMLQQCVLKLEVNEYVGYEEDDPNEEQDHFPGDNSTRNLPPVYKYVKVIEVVKPQKATSYVNYSYMVNLGDTEYVLLRAPCLYQFIRNKAEKAALETHERPGDSQTPDVFDILQSTDLNGIKAEINKQLKEAWQMRDDLRKKVVKRLWLQWHPDKNPDREKLATKVFQYIQWAIDRIGKHLPLVEEADDNSSNYNFQRRTYHEFWDHFYFSGYSSRAKSHSRRHTEGNTGFRSGPKPAWKQTKNRQPTEAWRWMKQANHDLASVKNDLDGRVIYHEWACLKCHHAAEKALKATQIAVDANKMSSTDHSLEFLCEQVPGCRETVQQLQKLIGDPEIMCFPSGGIPHDRFTEDQSSEASDLAQTILQGCETFIDSLMP